MALGLAAKTPAGTLGPGAVAVPGNATITDAVQYALINGITFASALKVVGEFLAGLWAAWKRPALGAPR